MVSPSARHELKNYTYDLELREYYSIDYRVEGFPYYSIIYDYRHQPYTPYRKQHVLISVTPSIKTSI